MFSSWTNNVQNVHQDSVDFLFPETRLRFINALIWISFYSSLTFQYRSSTWWSLEELHLQTLKRRHNRRRFILKLFSRLLFVCLFLWERPLLVLSWSEWWSLRRSSPPSHPLPPPRWWLLWFWRWRWTRTRRRQCCRRETNSTVNFSFISH